MLADTMWLLVELVVLFFGITFLVQLFQRRMGSDRIRAWMGGTPIAAALKGITLGFLTPFCTFTAIPMLIGMRQAQVPPAGYVAFIVAAPVLDPVLFGALIIIVGLKAALLYMAITFVAAMTLAIVAEVIDIEKHLKPIEQEALVTVPAGHSSETPAPDTAVPDTGTCGSGTAPAPWAGAAAETAAAARGAVDLLRGMAPLILLGIAISVVIETAIPPETAATVTGSSPGLAIPIAAVLGTPLYVSTSLFVPIADSLRDAGAGIGAIVALTIAGAGANLPEFVLLSKLAKPRVIAIFFGYVFLVAVIGGLLAEALVGP